MATDGSSTNRFLPPADNFGRPGSGFEPPYFTEQRPGGRIVDDGFGFDPSPSLESLEPTSDQPDDGLLKLYNKRGTHDPTSTFGIDYSNYYDAFSRSLKESQVRRASASAAVAKRRPAANRKFGSRRKSTHSHVSLPKSVRKPSPVVPAKRSAPGNVEEAKRVKLTPLDTSVLVDDQTATPKGVAQVVEKGHATKMKGSGIYTKGNWAWISDEEDGGKVDEKILEEARQIAAFGEASAEAPAKMTRRQLQDLKAKIGGTSPATTPVSGQRPFAGLPASTDHAGNGVRPSRRASRVAVNYSEPNPIEDDENDESEPVLPTEERTPSTMDSPISHGSTPLPDQASRSTSASTVPHQPDVKSEQFARPKLSWNAIVYEVFAKSTIPEMTLSEVQQGVVKLFPFFGLPENSKTLMSSPRNPLYLHGSFYKTQRADGMIAWGIKPGDFVDKKTGKVLNSNAGRPTTSIEPTTPSAVQQEITQAQSTAPLSTPPTSNSETEVAASTSSDTHPSKSPASMRSLRGTPAKADVTSIDKDQDQDKKSLSRAVSRESQQEVPETQLPVSSPQEVVETQISSSSPQEVMETQQSTEEEPAAPPVTQSREQRRLEGIVHTNLTETFKAEEMESFLRQTKLCYFKDMILTPEDIVYILSDIFPERIIKSTDTDIAACARELQSDYQQRIWASDWFQDFIKTNVHQFDAMNAGFLKYSTMPKPSRLNMWLARSRWNKETCARILSPLADAIDIDKIWTTKHWHDFVQKLYSIACDATCELRGQGHVFREIKAALDERYPDRESSMWNVPTVPSAAGKGVPDRKASIASTVVPATRPGSATGSVLNTPVKTVSNPVSSWFSTLSANKKPVGGGANGLGVKAGERKGSVVSEASDGKQGL